MSREMKTTTLSIEPPSLTYDSPATSDPPAGFQHVLVLDFEEAAPDEAAITKDSRAYSLFLHRLRFIVRHDGRDSPQIDMVQMIGRQPDARTCKVLDGLRPRHFEVESDLLRADDLEWFEQLNWPLESFMVTGVIGGYIPPPSKFIRRIPSLTLRSCSGLFFLPATDPSTLRHLTIGVRDTLDSFTDLMEKLCVAGQLETLKLHCSNDDLWDSSQINFMNTLRRCTSLHSLDLYFVEGWWNDDSEFSTPFKDLPRYFPDTIEYLRFTGSQDIGKDLSVWLQCAAEPSWLPSLKMLSFEIETNKLSCDLSIADTDAQVEKFLGALLQSHPAVQITLKAPTLLRVDSPLLDNTFTDCLNNKQVIARA